MTLRMPGVPYLGPPDSNWSGAGATVRPPNGMVVHIAEGSYQGTINWQRNPDADVSSFFVTSRAGEIAQMLDLDLMAWTQAAGNPNWVGVENEGFHTDQFTDAQVTANARIYAWMVTVWPGLPYASTSSTSGRGVGWHGMGGSAWGNHPDCPGPNNVALLPTIVARAQEINGGGAPPPAQEDEMSVRLLGPQTGYGAQAAVRVFPTDLGMALEILHTANPGDLPAAAQLWGDVVYVNDARVFGTPIEELEAKWRSMGGTGSLVDHTHVPGGVA